MNGEDDGDRVNPREIDRSAGRADQLCPAGIKSGGGTAIRTEMLGFTPFKKPASMPGNGNIIMGEKAGRGAQIRIGAHIAKGGISRRWGVASINREMKLAVNLAQRYEWSACAKLTARIHRQNSERAIHYQRVALPEG